MSEKINRTAKVTLDPKPEVPEANKTTADDWNETWGVVNSHADEIELNKEAISSISTGLGDSSLLWFMGRQGSMGNIGI